MDRVGTESAVLSSDVLTPASVERISAISHIAEVLAQAVESTRLSRLGSFGLVRSVKPFGAVGRLSPAYASPLEGIPDSVNFTKMTWQ